MFRAFNLRQSNASSAGTTFGFYFFDLRTDCLFNGVETAGCNFSATLEGTGANVWLHNFWLDAFKDYGLRILDNSPQSRTNVMDFYAAPASGATAQAVYLDGCNNVVLTGEITAIAGTSDSRSAVLMEDCVRCSIDVTVFGHGRGVDMQACFGCEAKCRYTKFNGTGLAAIRIQNGAFNKATPSIINVTGSVTTTDAISAATTGNNTYDVTMVDAAAVTNKIRQDGVAVTTQGNVGGNVVINPGAGAML